MIQDILVRHNRNIILSVSKLKDLLAKATVPDELNEYKDLITQVCEEVISLANRNLSKLPFLVVVDILEDLISDTQMAIGRSLWLSSTVAPPILRASEADRLSLVLIGWLNKTHIKTIACPPALGSGSWGVIPYTGLPLYFLPAVEQRGLLYQPLLFHEFGHVLYEYHKQEMRDLVKELQYEIIDQLAPISQRNDAYENKKRNERQGIIRTWYYWIQELFCDAVGFTIGGPCFLYAFSGYLENMHPGDFHAKPEELHGSTHPLKWLRIRLLTNRARKEGFPELADEVQKEWDHIARSIGIIEDYYGYYDKVLDKAISNTIDDMLTEADPRHYQLDEIVGNGGSIRSESPILLLNQAWDVFRTTPTQYDEWESHELVKLLIPSQYEA